MPTRKSNQVVVKFLTLERSVNPRRVTVDTPTGKNMDLRNHEKTDLREFNTTIETFQKSFLTYKTQMWKCM